MVNEFRSATLSGSTHRTRRHRIRGSARVATLLLACLALSGCGAGYLLQAARGQLQLMHRRQPIPKVIASPATDAKLRARLEQVQGMRDFASQELGLPDNQSYRSYADLGRPYVVWNVVAAPEFSVTPRHWCYPFVGCLAYRGYFREQTARDYAARLKAEGNDVLVAGVSAYSTLGHFSDPVLNTMLGYGDLELAGTLFHELAHQLVYVKGDTLFNESFAMAVEREGLARWLRTRGREAELAGFLARDARQQSVVARLAAARGELMRLYREPLPVDEMRQRKQAVLAQLDQDVLELEHSTGFVSGYSAWAHAGFNNAHLVAVSTYYDCVPAFEQLLQENHASLPDFYTAVRGLAKQTETARRQFCNSGSAPR